MVYRSEDIDKIMGALATAQGSYKKLVANVHTAGGDYANLDALLAATRDALAANALAFYQYIEIIEEGSGAALLRTMLGHESNQWISSCARVYAGETDRESGTTIEIHKRIHAAMILGIAPSPQDPYLRDDDGEEEYNRAMAEGLKKPPRERKSGRNVPITKDQYELLMLQIGNDKILYEGVLKFHKIETLHDLPAHEFVEALNRIKNAHKAEQEHLLRSQNR